MAVGRVISVCTRDVSRSVRAVARNAMRHNRESSNRCVKNRELNFAGLVRPSFAIFRVAIVSRMNRLGDRSSGAPVRAHASLSGHAMRARHAVASSSLPVANRRCRIPESLRFRRGDWPNLSRRVVGMRWRAHCMTEPSVERRTGEDAEASSVDKMAV